MFRDFSMEDMFGIVNLRLCFVMEKQQKSR